MLLFIFRSPQKKKKIQKQIKKIRKKIKKICSEKRCRSAQKITKNWMRRFKNTKIKISQYIVD
jgi:membrane protein insertase Oxa1/YidC/SpoIIIJ